LRRDGAIDEAGGTLTGDLQCRERHSKPDYVIALTEDSVHRTACEAASEHVTHADAQPELLSQATRSTCEQRLISRHGSAIEIDEASEHRS
jgi:hypothetical protein